MIVMTMITTPITLSSFLTEILKGTPYFQFTFKKKKLADNIHTVSQLLYRNNGNPDFPKKTFHT